MKKILLLTVLLASPLVFTACGGENDNPADDTDPANDNVESQEAMSTMNDMVSKMDDLDYISFDFDVLYPETEFEGTIDNDNGLVESEYYDPFNEVYDRGKASFDAVYPIVQELELSESMTDEEAIETSLEAFNIPGDYLKAELQIILSDGTEKTYYINRNEL